MDCDLCSVLPVNLRPQRSTICSSCYESGREIISLINAKKADEHRKLQEVLVDRKATTSLVNSLVSPQNPSKGLIVALRWVMDAEKCARERIEFLGSFAASFHDQIHTDIFVKAGHNGIQIPAHKGLLSRVFKHMLESDRCKAPPNDTITFYEFNDDELKSFLEFLYKGDLPLEKLNKHIYALSLAADKYGIKYLQMSCERHMMSSLNSTNVLNTLEISDCCRRTLLKETALKFIVNHMEEIVFSDKFEPFALKNPHLSVIITRASFRSKVDPIWDMKLGDFST